MINFKRLEKWLTTLVCFSLILPYFNFVGLIEVLAAEDSNGELVFQNFESGSSFRVHLSENGLGEITNEESFQGNQSLKYTNTLSEVPGESGVFIKNQESIDATDYTYLSFWIKENGSNGAGVEVKDINGKGTGWEWQAGPDSTPGEWTQMYIPLENFKNEIDWTKVNEVMITEYWANDYYIDQITFTNVLEQDLIVESSLAPGEYEGIQEIELTNNNEATIYYTLDGTDPSTESQRYTEPIVIEDNTEIKAIAVKEGVTSQIQLFSYIINKDNYEEDEQDSEPAIIFENFENNDEVLLLPAERVSGEITTDEAYIGNQSLHYQVSESGDPSINSGSLLFEKTSSVDASAYEYLTFWIKDTQGNNGIKVALQDENKIETSFENVWVDGAIKDIWTPISIPLSNYSNIDLTTLNGIRFGEWNSGSYYIDNIMLTNFNYTDLEVVSSVASGNYNEPQLVELSTITDAKIYYTLDGSTPDTTSMSYNQPIEISDDTVIKAVAEKDGILGQANGYHYTINTFKIRNIESTWLQMFDYDEDSYSFSERGASGEIVSDDDRGSNVLAYRVSESSSPEINDGSVVIQSENPIDVSELNYLIFFMKDMNGSNNMKLSIIDENGNETDFGANGWRNGLYTEQNEWVQYYVPIEDLVGNVDLTKITGVRIGQWNAGTYYIDSVYFDNYLFTDEPEIKPAVPQANLADGYQFEESLEIRLMNRTGDEVYYTLDGSTPTLDSLKYNEPIVVTETTELNAVSVARNTFSDVVSFNYSKVSTVLGAVVADKPSGKYEESFEVQLNAEEGTEIFYTTDGTAPDSESSLYNNSIPVTESTQLKAIAIRDDQQSNIATFDYHLTETPEAPTFSIEEEVHHQSFKVEIIGSLAGEVYYTTDGTEPTINSQRYKEPLNLNVSTNVRAIVVEDGITSEVGEKHYRIIPRGVNADKPVGNYTDYTIVEFRGEVDNLEIYYTVDGSLPTENGYDLTENSKMFSGPIKVTEDTTFNVVARYPRSKHFSDVQTFSYTIKDIIDLQEPKISPESGTYGDRQVVNIVTPTSGAEIYYTTDGSEPTIASNRFVGEFTVLADTIVKAIAVKEGKVSPIVTNDYTITTVESPFLKVDGKDMRNNYGAGEVVLLKGTNIGGWATMEEWQSPTNAPDQKTMLETLTSRFGEERTWELVEQFQDTWFNEDDFDVLKEEGVNLLRLPISYFEMADENGHLTDYGRERLEWFLEEAEKREMYVLIDLHGAFGSQNGKDHSGDISNPDVGDFFGNEENIQKTIRLWKDIAEVGKGNPWVAGYDLLNEPGGALGTEQFEVYDRLYRAVREVDQDHIIHIQAIWEPMHLPNPEFYDWENVVYQYHFYGWDDLNNFDYQKAFIDSKVTMVNDITNYDVPVFVGEFTFFENIDSWEYGLSTFEQEGWSYTSWTYKVSGQDSSWGMYTAPRTSNEVVDIYNDDFDTIKEKWSVTTEEGFTRNEPIANVLSKYFKGSLLVDTEAPEIYGEDAEVELGTTQSVGEIIKLYVKDNVDGVLYPERDSEAVQTFQMTEQNVMISEFDSSTLGEQTIVVTATDTAGNTSEPHEFIVTVVEAVEEADKSELVALIAEVEALDFDRYTEESVEILSTALENAYVVVDDSDATVDEVSAAVDELLTAIDALELIEDADDVDGETTDPEEPTEPDEDSGEAGEDGELIPEQGEDDTNADDSETESDEDGDLPDTGESSPYIFIALGIVLIAVGGIMFVVDSRKNEI